MAFNYLKAHQRMIRQAVIDRGHNFGALYDISRWHQLTPGDAQALADEVGITLSEAERVELRERWEEAERLDALALGRETRKAEELPVRWVAENQEHEPRERQTVLVVKRAAGGVNSSPIAVSIVRVAPAVPPSPPPIKRIDFNRKKT